MEINNKKIKYETICELVSQPNSIGGTAYQSTNKTKKNKTKQNVTHRIRMSMNIYQSRSHMMKREK